MQKHIRDYHKMLVLNKNDPEHRFVCVSFIFKIGLFYFLNSGSTHAAASTESKWFKCNKCNINLDGEKYLEYHNQIYHVHKTNNCYLCGKAFKEKNYILKHIRRFHLDERDYKCRVCGATFFQGSNLKQHYSNVHNLVHEKIKKNNV